MCIRDRYSTVVTGLHDGINLRLMRYSDVLLLSLIHIFGGMAVYPTPVMATVTQSPTIKVRGQVVDEQGEPMPGATVRVKGGQGGTITDLDGNFQLEVSGNAILSISYVGFKEREVAVRNRAIIETIQLQADDQMLDQVVVVGYGTQKKSDLTGSVAVVDLSLIHIFPVSWFVPPIR